MPRRRTSNKPIRRRIKLDHKGDALTEMCRTFRAVKNGDLARADGVRDITMLDKIHSGMPEHTAGPLFTPPNISIFSVPNGFFLSLEQIQTISRGEQIIEPSQCTPLPIALDEPESGNVVVPLRQLDAPIDQDTPQLTALEEKLLAMSHEELVRLAEVYDVGK